MSRAAAIGERARTIGYALAGVEVLHADDAEAARAAWASLDPDVGLVLLTPVAFAALEDALATQPWRAWVLLPE
jgi:vacuolar-type H+-ATPase subunit F/Vma7